MLRLFVPLRPEEHEALIRWASRERRDPRSQAALLLRRELERLGLLKPECDKGQRRREDEDENG